MSNIIDASIDFVPPTEEAFIRSLEGKPVRNVDPIQYMIRSILSGDMKLNIVDKQPDIIKKRILRDITDIVNGKSLLWMPRKFKLKKNRQSDLLVQLKKY